MKCDLRPLVDLTFNWLKILVCQAWIGNFWFFLLENTHLSKLKKTPIVIWLILACELHLKSACLHPRLICLCHVCGQTERSGSPAPCRVPGQRVKFPGKPLGKAEIHNLMIDVALHEDGNSNLHSWSQGKYTLKPGRWVGIVLADWVFLWGDLPLNPVFSNHEKCCIGLVSPSFLTQEMLYRGKPQHTSKTTKSSVCTFNVSSFLQIFCTVIHLLLMKGLATLAVCF